MTEVQTIKRFLSKLDLVFELAGKPALSEEAQKQWVRVFREYGLSDDFMTAFDDFIKKGKSSGEYGNFPAIKDILAYLPNQPVSNDMAYSIALKIWEGRTVLVTSSIMTAAYEVDHMPKFDRKGAFMAFYEITKKHEKPFVSIGDNKIEATNTVKDMLAKGVISQDMALTLGVDVNTADIPSIAVNPMIGALHHIVNNSKDTPAKKKALLAIGESIND
ncbi:MAG: hypothetical protein QM504_07965 [Pseudomonadota bacterium]